VEKKLVQKLRWLQGELNLCQRRPYQQYRLSRGGYKSPIAGPIPDYHNVRFAIKRLPFIGKQNAKNMCGVRVPGQQYFQYQPDLWFTSSSYNSTGKKRSYLHRECSVASAPSSAFGVDRRISDQQTACKTIRTLIFNQLKQRKWKKHFSSSRYHGGSPTLPKVIHM